MRIKHLFEGLNRQQRSVPQLPAQARARHISVLGAKTDPKHPFAGYMVGADESAEPGRKRIGPDRNDPYEKGWHAQPDAANPYAAGTPEHSKWQDGRDERAAQPRHYDESVDDDDMPDLEEVGEPVSSIMDAERRMAAGDRIFVAHEMDEEPFEIFNVGDLAGYTYDQVLAVPQDIAEGRAGVDDRDTVGFSVNTEAAYTAVMKRFGDVIDHDETSGIMSAPAGVWPQIEMVAYDADGIGAQRDDDLENPEHSVSEGNKSEITATNKNGYAEFGGIDDFILKNLKDKTRKHPTQEKNIKQTPHKKKGLAETERNELDTPAVQAALAKMAERHKGEKWSKEQLAALGKRIAARGKKPVKEDVTKEDVISKLKAKLGDYLSDLSKEIKSDPDLVDKLAAKAPSDQMGPPVKTVTTDDGHEIQIHGNEDDGFRISIKNKQSASKFKNLDEAVMACEMYCARRRKQNESADYVDEAGRDACYNKVKSRYKIWPSAYASGALVQCRKKGAANWGNKSKK